MSKSDTIDGWRDRRGYGGIVIDVQAGEVVIGSLSMPHSPRVYRNKLWVLNCGTGEIGWIERAAKARKAKFNVLAFCPGFVRGLAFYGKFAFVGLSKPRYQRFEGLELDRKLAETDSEPWCGVRAVGSAERISFGRQGVVWTVSTAHRESLESEICSSHIAARGGAGPWRAQRLVDCVCLQVGG